MLDMINQAKCSVAYWESVVDQHTLLHEAKTDMGPGNSSLEHSLINCLRLLEILIETENFKGVNLANFCLDIGMQYGPIPLNSGN